MPVTTINTTGTIQVKLGGGRLYNITGVSAGTSFAFRALDGADSAGNTRTLIGAEPYQSQASERRSTAASVLD